jgi:hypothetical protein
LRIAEVPGINTKPPDCQEGEGDSPSDSPAVHVRGFVETQLGEKASPLWGESREYWAWRSSKQEPTPLRSLEFADATINRELARKERIMG